jgi:1,4-alpha-glucan branching enzyme
MAKLVNMNSEATPKGDSKTQTFSLKAPAAKSVQLVGDFTHWQRSPINLAKGSDHVWRTSVELSAGPHRYRYLVDGQWANDPECPSKEPNPFGSEDNVRRVS